MYVFTRHIDRQTITDRGGYITHSSLSMHPDLKVCGQFGVSMLRDAVCDGIMWFVYILQQQVKVSTYKSRIKHGKLQLTTHIQIRRHK